MIVLSKQQILLSHSQLISETGGSDGLRDVGLLESAINSLFSNLEMKIYIQQFNKKHRDYVLVSK